jgi:uncharacterized membrane protein
MEAGTVWSIVLAIVAYSLLNIGLVLEKKGAAELPGIESAGAAGSIRNFLKNRTWLIGFILTNVQMVPLWMAMGLGSISLVAPMMGVGMVVLVVFSVFYLKEPINAVMLAGIALTIAGIAVLGAINPGRETLLTFDRTVESVAQAGPLAWLAGLVAGSILPVVVCRAMGWRLADVLFGLAAGFAASIGLVGSKLMMAGTAIEGGSLGDNLARWPFWVFVALMASGNAASMVLQQFGFQKGRAIVLAPIFAVCTVVFPALTGVVAFDEWARFDPWVVWAKSAAVLAIVAGVAVLSAASAGSQPAVPAAATVE